MSTRYAWVVWNFTEDMAQVWQASGTVFKAIQALVLDEDWGDPTTYSLNVSREGTGKETKYAVTPSPNKNPLPVAAQEAVDNFSLFDAVENAVPLSQVTQGAEPKAPKLDQKDLIPTAEEVEKINIDDIPF